jgi:hypothetical protein
MKQRNPSKMFSKKFEFDDNPFINNIFMPGPYRTHTNWAWQKHIAGKPIAMTAMGLLKTIEFANSNFYADGKYGSENAPSRSNQP